MNFFVRRISVAALAVVCPLALANCSPSPDSGSDSGASSNEGGSGTPGSGGAGSGSGSSGGGPSSGAPTSGGPSSGGPSSGVASGSTSGSGSSTGDDGGTNPPPSGDGGACAYNVSTQKSFVSLAVTPGAALDHNENDMTPGDGGAPPSGWNFYLIKGAMCRDGSPFGFYVHYASTSKLYIYLEGGGACNESHFCDHNPANMNEFFPGGEATQGQTIGGSLATVAGLQQPYVTGIFDTGNSANPLKDWSGVYVPYCTGDVHFGTADNVTINDDMLDVKSNQHFVGYLNMQKVVARLVPTFPGLSQILLTGASAGGIGAALNLGLVQDSFGTKVPVTVLDDSGPPSDASRLWPACLQKAWRSTWGFQGSLPSDCTECNQSDGSGLDQLVVYWHHKYPNAKVGLVSSMEDQVIRLFYGAGDNNCATNDANTLVLGGGGVAASDYTANLNNLRTQYACTNAISTYYIGKSSNYMDDTLHQHIFRGAEFFKALTSDGSMTLAQWTTDLVAGKLDTVGP